MDVNDKSEIIVQFIEEYFDDQEFSEFFEHHDLGVPLAIGHLKNLFRFTSEGLTVFNETWIGLCELFEADPNKEYDNIEDVMEAS